MTVDVVPSAAVTILRNLQRDGFTVQLTPADDITIAPRSRLTPERMSAISAHREALKQLLRCLADQGLVVRREAFAQQLARTRPPRVPAFLFRAGVVYAPGICFSCGDRLPSLTFGRCWRCAVAWRLACRVPISQDLASALDQSKVVG